MSPETNVLPTVYQEFIALSRYAKYDNEKKRREHWDETITRYCDFCRYIMENAKVKKELIESIIEEIRQSLLRLDVMASMRALMTAGPAAIRSPVAAYNCSFDTIAGTGPTVKLWDDQLEQLGYEEPITIRLNNPIVFDEAFFILLNGTGFGFSVERQFIANLPTVGKNLSRSIYKKTQANYPRVPKEDLSSYDKRSNTIIVADSKEGWASALRIFIVEMYNGNFDVKIDTSGVRPEGTPLKTFGGRASGPAVLEEMFENLRGIFEKANGRKLNSIECHDTICIISAAVVVGGVRRCLPGETLVLVGPDEWKPIQDFSEGDSVFFDNEYLNVTNVFYQGEQEVLRIELEDGKYIESTANHRWLVYDSNKDSVEWVMTKDLDSHHSLEKDSPFVKNVGVLRIAKTYDIEVDSDLHAFSAKGVGGAIGISHNSATISLSNLSDERMRYAKSGEWWVENSQRRLANNSAAYTEKPEIGTFMREWISLYESKSGERGIFNRQAAISHSAKYGRILGNDIGLNPCITGDTLVYVADGRGTVPIEKLSEIGEDVDVFCYDDNNNLVVRPMRNPRITGYNKPIYKMTLGDGSTFRTTDNHKFRTKEGSYKELKDLVVGEYLIAVGDESTMQISSIEFDGHADVYNGTVDEFHNFFIGGFEGKLENGKKKVIFINNLQCGEIILQPGQCCNLTAATVRPADTFESLKQKVRIATILGTIQATLSDFSYLNPQWKKTCEEERLLGVSLPGVMDHPILQNTSDESKSWLDELSQYVVDVNKEWAKLLGINPAAASRCQKPAGNSGELYDVSSGLHARFSPYYIRRVRADAKDPLAIVMKEQGFHCEENVMQPGSWVFSFPVKAPEHSVFRNERTAIEQLEYWLMWKLHWTDHNPSVTIYVKEEEWLSVGAWVYDHFDEVCGISFLPYSDHVYKQAPYEEITAEEYEELMSKTPKFIDHEMLQKIETSDHTTSMQEPACAAGGCEIM